MEEAWSLGFRGGVATYLPRTWIFPVQNINISNSVSIVFNCIYFCQINLHPRLYFSFDRLGDYNPNLHC